MDALNKFLGPLVAILTSLLAVAFGYGRLNQKVNEAHQDMYLPDGSWRFVPFNRYDEDQEKMCRKLDDIKSTTKKMQQQQSADMKELQNFMGRVEQYMTDRN